MLLVMQAFSSYHRLVRHRLGKLITHWLAELLQEAVLIYFAERAIEACTHGVHAIAELLGK